MSVLLFGGALAVDAAAHNPAGIPGPCAAVPGRRKGLRCLALRYLCLSIHACGRRCCRHLPGESREPRQLTEVSSELATHVPPHFPHIISPAPQLLCFVGVRVMASAQPFGLKRTLAAWNLLLALFSFVGFLRTAPFLVYVIGGRGLYASLCDPAETTYGNGAAGLWTMLFVWSKIPELLDTAFVIARKKPLIFLHWYHHATVLLYCWHSYGTGSSAGLYFIAMNYGVHSLMYFCESTWKKLLECLRAVNVLAPHPPCPVTRLLFDGGGSAPALVGCRDSAADLADVCRRGRLRRRLRVQDRPGSPLRRRCGKLLGRWEGM